MLFASPFFLHLYLPLLFMLYFWCFRTIKQKNILLLLASLFFYAWGEPLKISILLFSIIVNYYIAVLFLRPAISEKKRKIALTAGIGFNLLILISSKYTIPFLLFTDQNILSVPFFIPNFHLPLGVSFYTFQIISYLIDTYKNENKPQDSIFILSLYISFFPQLIAGPIIKYHEIEKEFFQRQSTQDDIAIGFKRFIIGLSKKVLIANTMAIAADDIFAVPTERLDTFIAWIGAICYTLQIYYDFSGYSDMAIGLGRIFGFHFCENFNFPYCSLSIKEFWRRWHISLSAWFKEYLYIPLGGNRCSKFRWNINLLIVFLSTGIWHGAAWNFVFWGILYGLLIVGENILWGEKIKKMPVYCRSFYTMFFVIIGWVFFRAENLEHGVNFCKKMLIPCVNQDLRCLDFFTPYFYPILLIALFFAAPFYKLFPQISEQIRHEKIKSAEIPLILLLLFMSMALLCGNTYNPFIYFRF